MTRPGLIPHHETDDSQAEDSSEVDKLLRAPQQQEDESDAEVFVSRLIGGQLMYHISFVQDEPQPAPPRRSKRQIPRFLSPETDDLPRLRPSRSSSSSSGSARSLHEPAKFLRSRKAKGKRAVAKDCGILAQDFLEDLADLNSDGITVISWNVDRETLAREFADFYACAADLRYDLQDEINRLDKWALQAGDMQRIVFEAAMRDADRPTKSPPIRIINNIDDEPAPRFEFIYTNLMYHSDTVPKPDFDRLEGCSCRGKCDPFSKTCSCIRRQRNADREEIYYGGFIWNEEGRLLDNGFPIVECNAKCGCSDACQNRVSILSCDFDD